MQSATLNKAKKAAENANELASSSILLQDGKEYPVNLTVLSQDKDGKPIKQFVSGSVVIRQNEGKFSPDISSLLGENARLKVSGKNVSIEADQKHRCAATANSNGVNIVAKESTPDKQHSNENYLDKDSKQYRQELQELRAECNNLQKAEYEEMLKSWHIVFKYLGRLTQNNYNTAVKEASVKDLGDDFQELSPEVMRNFEQIHTYAENLISEVTDIEKSLCDKCNTEHDKAQKNEPDDWEKRLILKDTIMEISKLTGKTPEEIFNKEFANTPDAINPFKSRFQDGKISLGITDAKRFSSHMQKLENLENGNLSKNQVKKGNVVYEKMEDGSLKATYSLTKRADGKFNAISFNTINRTKALKEKFIAENNERAKTDPSVKQITSSEEVPIAKILRPVGKLSLGNAPKQTIAEKETSPLPQNDNNVAAKAPTIKQNENNTAAKAPTIKQNEPEQTASEKNHSLFANHTLFNENTVPYANAKTNKTQPAQQEDEHIHIQDERIFEACEKLKTLSQEQTSELAEIEMTFAIQTFKLFYVQKQLGKHAMAKELAEYTDQLSSNKSLTPARKKQLLHIKHSEIQKRQEKALRSRIFTLKMKQKAMYVIALKKQATERANAMKNIGKLLNDIAKDHGKEAHMPILDESTTHVINHLTNDLEIAINKGQTLLQALSERGNLEKYTAISDKLNTLTSLASEQNISHKLDKTSPLQKYTPASSEQQPDQPAGFNEELSAKLDHLEKSGEITPEKLTVLRSNISKRGAFRKLPRIKQVENAKNQTKIEQSAAKELGA